MGILDTVKGAIFAETSDRGKVSQITWLTSTHGVATVHAPAAAYERFSKRATLRAIQIKVPHATRVHIIRHEYCKVRQSENCYYLVRAEFYSTPIPQEEP